MTPNADLITVIVPVYNGVRYIREALDSILAQEYAPREVLVVDDGSTDNVAEALLVEYTHPDVRYYRKEHAGLPAARNAGLAAATGRFIAFLDADDIWTEGKLAIEMEFLTAHPEMDAVFGHIRQFYSPDADESVRQNNRIAAEVMPGIHPDTMLVRVESVRRVGPFNPAVEMGEFLDWFARAQEAGWRYHMLPDVMALRRIHASNMSIQRRNETASSYAHLLKAALDRRRKRERDGTS